MAYQHFCVKIYFSFNLNGPIKKKICCCFASRSILPQSVLHQDLFYLSLFCIIDLFYLSLFCIKIYFTSVCFVSQIFESAVSPVGFMKLVNRLLTWWGMSCPVSESHWLSLPNLPTSTSLGTTWHLKNKQQKNSLTNQSAFHKIYFENMRFMVCSLELKVVGVTVEPTPGAGNSWSLMIMPGISSPWSTFAKLTAYSFPGASSWSRIT